MEIVLEGPASWVVIFFLVLALVSISVQIPENARQRRKLSADAGPNQQTREKSHLFFHTVLIFGLLTLIANYVMGVTSSLAATYLSTTKLPFDPFFVPGVLSTVILLLLYMVAVAIIYNLFLRDAHVGLPELLADLSDAQRLGTLNLQRISYFCVELDKLRVSRRARRAKAHTDKAFNAFFTVHESLARPTLMEQLTYLKNDARRPARTRYLLKRLFLNYKLAAGKWLVPLAIISLFSFGFTLQELFAPPDGVRDAEVVLTWAAAGVLGVATLAAQWFCELSKVALAARKEFIVNETEEKCQRIIDGAREQIAAESLATTARFPASKTASEQPSDNSGEGWRTVLQIGPWQARRRASTRKVLKP
ncbi:hypothetical protein [Arthrobacter cryoconiti]|uniref:Uncharacterized protein n=1 Tax=Arthrobacter cryoconiti TaxID=748907 RepID=A0ABV8R4R2_9MICC|nr:hypothetical protein [Arthrobacter cryoconiti]MCC9066876.1 hypothetical protein [Arthrobacter cryoconiti]